MASSLPRLRNLSVSAKAKSPSKSAKTWHQMGSRPLARAFFARPATEVARDLLGKVLVHKLDGHTLAGRIVETEAYLGGGDLAAHAARGLTPRTKVLFGPPGHAYVYFIYGMYECLNFVCEQDGTAGCVLIRALEPVAGIEEMKKRRPAARRLRDLTSGPGKLTLAMGITRQHYGCDLTQGTLQVREFENTVPNEIVVAKRIGISVSKDLPLRFHIKDNEFVSR
ncbi:MAG: DNA-3-methyladenine glycosylase [Bryobacterales bacterium]